MKTYSFYQHGRPEKQMWSVFAPITSFSLSKMQFETIEVLVLKEAH